MRQQGRPQCSGVSEGLPAFGSSFTILRADMKTPGSSRRAMDGAAPVPSTSELAEWCMRWLDAAPARLLWSRHHLSHVFGIELVDAREVVVKVRTHASRIT